MLLNMDLKYLTFYIFAISGICFCEEELVDNKISLDTQTTGSSTLSLDPNNNDLQATTQPYFEYTTLHNTDSFETTSKEDTTTTNTAATTATIKIVTNPPRDTSCTCGIFLSSQLVKGFSDQPKGDPVISNLMDFPLPCNIVGKKKCQTKCLEQIVKHLPNSGNILCASLDRDIHKEKAFLFIRNCNKKWHNTNLSANREYCCKNGAPYNCRKKFFF